MRVPAIAVRSKDGMPGKGRRARAGFQQYRKHGGPQRPRGAEGV